MANAEMLRPFVEKAVGEVLGLETVKKEPNGDIPVANGSSLTLVRVIDGPVGPLVRFFSRMLSGVKNSPELLERLNTLNTEAYFVRFLWANDEVFCSVDIDAENVQTEEIGNALHAVAYHADEYDDVLQKQFGGDTAIGPEARVRDSERAVSGAAPGSTAPGYL